MSSAALWRTPPANAVPDESRTKATVITKTPVTAAPGGKRPARIHYTHTNLPHACAYPSPATSHRPHPFRPARAGNHRLSISVSSSSSTCPSPPHAPPLSRTRPSWQPATPGAGRLESAAPPSRAYQPRAPLTPPLPMHHSATPRNGSAADCGARPSPDSGPADAREIHSTREIENSVCKSLREILAHLHGVHSSVSSLTTDYRK